MAKMISSYWKTVKNATRIQKARKRCSQKSAREFFNQLKNDANDEKDIDGDWHHILLHYFVDSTNNNPDHLAIQHIPGINWDGYLAPRGNQTLNIMFVSLRLLMEFKRQDEEYKPKTLQDPFNRAAIVAQVIHYMKKIYDNGTFKEPTVIIGADENEAFILPGKLFYNYIHKDYDWKITPRQAFENKDPKLINDLRKDGNMNVFPFQFDRGNFKQKYFNLLDMFISIDNIGNGRDEYKIPVNSNNLTDIYSQFNDIAFKPNQHISSVESVNIFMQLITSPWSTKYYINPHDPNLFVADGRNIKVNGSSIDAFMSKYNRRLKPSLKKKLKGIADRLIEIEQRRYKGDFWTPSVWAKEADKLMDKEISPYAMNSKDSNNYKKTSLVWDCAAGVRNLTRDFPYSDLYISTYHEAEIELGSEYNKSKKAAFQYDFLNDDVLLNPKDNPDPNDWKMPNNLFNELKSASKTGKRVIFYTNPPYGLGKNKESKDIANNKINELMQGKHLGNASHQLFAQFFWRIFKIIKDFKLKNVYIAFFTEVPYFTGGDWKNFNHILFSKFKWINGFMFSAGEFSGTSKTWAINFSIFKLREVPIKNNKYLNKLHFPFILKQSYLDKTKHRQIKTIGKHIMKFVYNNDSLTNWAKKPFKNIESSLIKLPSNIYPQLSSGLKESKGKNPSGFLCRDSLGYMVLHADNIELSGPAVWIVSGSAYKGHGLPIEPNKECLNRAVVAFAARKSITDTWFNDRDNFSIPNTNNSIYPEFVNDSLIFSIFSPSSNQTAFRIKKYSNTGIPGYWANKWFWLSNKYVKDMADDNGNDAMYNDAEKGHDTYIYKQIQERSFSKEAEQVLQDATKVWNDIFKYRDAYSKDYSNYYLNAWDAGWYQMKLMPKTKDLDSFKKFKNDFQILTNKLSNNVYKLGMLNK